MKFLSKKLILFSIFYFLFSIPVFAQSINMQNAVEGLKERTGNLAETKEDKTDDAALAINVKITALKQIFNFSETEAKELKIKLIALDRANEQTTAWADSMLGKINEALKYYTEQREALEINQEKITLRAIKDMASDFKIWREENFMPVVVQIREFFLIQQERKAVQTAAKRSQKIGDELGKLEIRRDSRDIVKLMELFEKANRNISEANQLNGDAQEMFWNRYTYTVSSETSLVQIFADNDSLTEKPAQSGNSKSLSIKDLVSASLNKLKESYSIFIEMGNLVRKLPR